jgi:hypothetical protein
MVYRLKRLHILSLLLGKLDTVRDRQSAIAVEISRKDQRVIKFLSQWHPIREVDGRREIVVSYHPARFHRRQTVSLWSNLFRNSVV